MRRGIENHPLNRSDSTRRDIPLGNAIGIELCSRAVIRDGHRGAMDLPKKITACPGWLEISPDRTSFILLPERAEVVKLIFDWSVAGVGAYTIAKSLDARRVPTFGSSETW